MPRTAVLGENRLIRIGLGTNRLADIPENRSFLEAAVNTDLNFIDTAHLYTGGESERAIGAALAPFADDLVVGTKGGYNAGGGVEGLRAEVEESSGSRRSPSTTHTAFTPTSRSRMRWAS
jgi:aryl-alcohol dehydrogenase-like predicted oxidoreductase